MPVQTPTRPQRQQQWPSANEIAAIAHDAVQGAISMHKKLGIPIVVWEDGKAVEVPPEDIVVEPKITK